MLRFDPNLIPQILTVMAAVTAGGLSLFLAGWMVLQALKREMPWLKRYIVRIVLGLAALLVVTYMVVPVVFVAIVCTIMIAALFLAANESIKGMGSKPPDKPAA
jgi:hypothetical protein